MTAPAGVANQRSHITDWLSTVLASLFAGLGSWRDADADRFTTQAAPLVRGAQQAMATLVAAYLAQQAGQATGTVVAPPVIPAAAITDIRGVDAREVYRRPFQAVWAALAGGKTLPEALQQGQTRLGELADGDMQLAYAHANRAGMQALPDEARPHSWRRVLRGASSCALCVLASTHRYSTGDLNPIHPRCVPEGSRVRADQVLAVARRSYTGELAVLTTASGDQVSVTPNHPVLTAQGWIAAGSVREGDHLVDSSAFQREVGHGPEEHDRPPLIEDVWRAASVTGLVRVPVSAEDFYGDGSQGEVDIVSTNGDLAPVWDAAELQSMTEDAFVRDQSGRGLLAADGLHAAVAPTSGTTAHGLMRGIGSGSTLLGSHLCGTHAASLRLAADGNPVFAQHTSDRVAGDVTFGREGVLRFSAEVGGSQVLDRVTAVGRVPFAGHVYDLQTTAEVYEANNHIVHNCDCDVEPIFGRDEHRAADDAVLERVHAAVRELTGDSSRGGRGVDYRQVQITQTHGELGPMLARPGDHFTGPEQIPSS